MSLATPDPAPAPAAAPRVALADFDPALAALIAEWLRDAGLVVHDAAGVDSADTASGPGAGAEALLVHLPQPRLAAPRLAALAAGWPGTPVLVVSPAFFGSVPLQGEVARSLGVAGVLPTPLSRRALLAALAACAGSAR